MKLIVITLLSLLAFSSFSQLSGTYTVGGISPDFATVGEACTAIEAQGVTGPVTINIRDGIYMDSIYLTAVSGVSAVNTIIFQSESMNAANVEITNGTHSPVKLDGETVDYISIQHLTLTITTATNVVQVFNGVNNFSLTHCVLNGFISSNTSVNRAVLRVDDYGGLDNDMITISNNTINNGSYGIYFENTNLFGNLTITNNTISNSYNHSIDVKKANDLHLADNVISNTPPFSTYSAGIKVDECIGNLIIERNEIYLTNQPGGNGIDLQYLPGTVVVKNNILSMPGINSNAVYIDYAEADIAFYNNTFRVGGNVFDGYFDVQMNIFNNVLISTNGGLIYDISYNTLTVPPITNYNAHYTTGDFAYYNAPYDVTYASFNDYQVATGQGSNSFELVDYMFVDNELDLHTCSDSLIGTGMYISSVLVDVDGEPRSVIAPSIGADYFNNNGSLWNNDIIETCIGVPVTLDAGVSDSYLWSTTETTQSISASNFGEYTVEWTNSCGTYSDTVTINDITPVASFSSVQSFITFQFTNTSQNGTSYLWDFGDGNTSTETNPTHVYSNLNTYTVTLTVTNSCGTDVSTMQVTPSTVGMDEINETSIIVYPNPSNGIFSLKSDAVIDEISVQDGMGRIVYQATGNSSNNIDLSALDSGVYFLVMQAGNQQLLKRIEIIK